MQEKTYLKVVLLGKVNSGKTCLVTRYITRSFSEETPSVSKFSFNNFCLFFKNLLVAVRQRYKFCNEVVFFNLSLKKVKLISRAYIFRQI